MDPIAVLALVRTYGLDAGDADELWHELTTIPAADIPTTPTEVEAAVQAAAGRLGLDLAHVATGF